MVSTDEFYKDPVLQKISNTVDGPVSEMVEDYTELFSSESIKLLAIGDPGIGKSSWVKKIVIDWIKGRFKKDSILFL